MLQATDAGTTLSRRNLAYVGDGAFDTEVADIVRNMRASDRFEAQAVGFRAETDVPLMVAAATDVYTAYLDADPVFIFGTIELLPGVRQLFGFGTDKTRRVIPSVTWFTRHHWLPELFDIGVRRIQVHVPAETAHSVRWLRSFGMYVECEMREYAANGATMLQLAYTKREFDGDVLH